LTPGIYYWGTTNDGSTSTTACYTVCNVFSSSLTLPRWGYVSTSAGTMPGSITPGSISTSISYEQFILGVEFCALTS
jgi:hypothetical protein